MSFQDKLKANQMKHAETALLQTIFQDPGQTIGDIWEALEADTESEAMWEMFKRLAIGTLVTAGVAFAEKGEKGVAAKTTTPAKPKKVKPAKAEKEEEEDEEDFEDEDDDFEDEDDDSEDEEEDDDDDSEEDDDSDDEDEDDDSDDEDDDSDEDDDDEDEEDEPKRAKSRKKDKATSSKKGDDGTLDLSTPDAVKAYLHAIIKCLKTNKAKSEEKAMRSTPIREAIGGDAKQFRDAINELIESERVSFSGKARGTQYWLS